MILCYMILCCVVFIVYTAYCFKTLIYFSGFSDGVDNCPLIPNPGQDNIDGDNVGDDCDNCKTVSNTAQIDTDQNGVGDSCDPTTNKDR